MISKAQLSIISSRFCPVNLILASILVFSLLATSSCGFQLNRNRASLPGSASSISIDKIVNRSYTPGLDIALRESLIDHFARKAITVSRQGTADLSLSVEILSVSQARKSYSYDTSGTENFEFTYSIQARLSLIQAATNETAISPSTVSGISSVRSDDQDLSGADAEQALNIALDSLSSRIIDKLTQSF